MHKIINRVRCIYTPTYVSAFKLPSSGGIHQRVTSIYGIQIQNSWLYNSSCVSASIVKPTVVYMPYMLVTL
jgi:hypothetical protein